MYGTPPMLGTGRSVSRTARARSRNEIQFAINLNGLSPLAAQHLDTRGSRSREHATQHDAGEPRAAWRLPPAGRLHPGLDARRPPGRALAPPEANPDRRLRWRLKTDGR